MDPHRKEDPRGSDFRGSRIPASWKKWLLAVASIGTFVGSFFAASSWRRDSSDDKAMVTALQDLTKRLGDLEGGPKGAGTGVAGDIGKGLDDVAREVKTLSGRVDKMGKEINKALERRNEDEKERYDELTEAVNALAPKKRSRWGSGQGP